MSIGNKLQIFKYYCRIGVAAHEVHCKEKVVHERVRNTGGNLMPRPQLFCALSPPSVERMSKVQAKKKRDMTCQLDVQRTSSHGGVVHPSNLSRPPRVGICQPSFQLPPQRRAAVVFHPVRWWAQGGAVCTCSSGHQMGGDLPHNVAGLVVPALSCRGRHDWPGERAEGGMQVHLHDGVPDQA